MKKFLFSIAALALMASCSNNAGTDSSNNEDNNGATDSATQTVAADNAAEAAVDAQAQQEEAAKLAAEETAKAEAEAKAAEAAEFSKVIPDPKKVYWEDKAGSYLKNLGYTGSQKKTTAEWGDDMLKGKYSISKGDKSCTVTYETFSNGSTVKVTIKGDDEALKSFYSKAKKLAGSGYEWYCEVKKSGNTVTIEGGGA